MDSTLSGSQLERPAVSPERGLLLLAAGFLFVNYLSLGLQRQQVLQVDFWLQFALWMACAFGGQRVLQRVLPRRDPLLFPVMMFLSGWGLVLIARLEPFFAARQAVWLLLATVALLLVAASPHVLRWLRAYRYTILVGGLLLLLATIVLGQNPTGSATAPQLWLGFGTIYFQPSEVLKVLLVIFLASYLSEQYPSLRMQETFQGRWAWLSPRTLGPIVLMWGLSIVLVIWQRDLGTAALFFAVFLILLYVASGQLSILVGGFVLLLIAGFVGYQLFDVVALRVDIWLNPWPEADGRAYQIVQSLMAFASGGIFGDGIGQGSPNYIPVVHSDFIFAALAEEYGLLGVFTVLGSIAVWVSRGLRSAALLNERTFYALLAVGLSVLIAVQSLLIMAGVLKLLPLTGVTLPFMSYGGSSLLMSFVIGGLLLRLSAEAQRWH